MDKQSNLLADIFSLSMKIENETEHAVFFDYSGHVELLNVDVVKSKVEYTKKMMRFESYTDEDSLWSLEMMRDEIEEFYTQAVNK